MPAVGIGERGMSVMWMPAETTLPPGASALSAAGTSGPAEAKMSARRDARAGLSVLPAQSRRATGKRLGALVALPGERVHLSALVHRHLADHVGGRAEAVQARAVAASPARRRAR